MNGLINFSAGAAVALFAAAAPCVQAAPAQAGSDDLARLVNRYRASPAACGGERMPALAPLTPHPALASLRIRTGTMLPSALEEKGYLADHVQAMSISGPADAAAAFAVAVERYCSSLRDARFQTIGVARNGNSWQIVLARPAPPRPPPPPPLPPVEDIGQLALDAVNRARASARYCGAQHQPPAPPLQMNGRLDEAALAHSRDMASHGFFSHEGKDGTRVNHRVQAAGFTWIALAENIAYGQRSIEEAVQSWVDSPGHCINIMNPRLTKMGIAYATAPGKGLYWTQVMGTPR